MIKDYYSLNELETKYSIPKEDVFWLAERKEIKLFAFVRSKNIALGYRANGKFNGVGVLKFRGMMLLYPQLTSDLWDNQQVEVWEGIFMNPQLDLLSNEYPFSIQTPNAFVDSWDNNGLSKLNEKFSIGRFLPEEKKHFAASIFSTVEPFITNKEFKSELVDQLNDFPNRVLAIKKEQIYLADVRIHREGLERLQTLHSKLEQTHDNSESYTSRLARQVIQANPTASAGKLFQLLKDDSESEPSSFDTDNIILEITKNEIKIGRASCRERV